jgi:hypothetical protein
VRKASRVRETNADGTSFEEGDLVRLKRTGERGQFNAVDGGVRYVLMDGAHVTRLFSASRDEDALCAGYLEHLCET